MSIISEIKCARCDRKYSGVRSRCPYCGARRIGSGKYYEEGDNTKGKMIIGVLIMAVLVVAAGILLFTTKPKKDPVGPTGQSVSESSSPTIPPEDDITTIPGPDATSPDEDDIEDIDETPTPEPIKIESVTITYAGLPATDFSEPVGTRVPLRVKIEPAGVEFSEEIIWESSNISVFDVVKDNIEGTSAIVTIIGKSGDRNAVLTVSVGDVQAKCIIRVK